MQAERHQVVHQIVAARDAVKNVIDQRLLGRKRHPFGAELGGFCHRCRPRCATIARPAGAGYVFEINYVAAAALNQQCPSFRKWKQSAVVSKRPWTANASRASRSGGPICAGRWRRTLRNDSMANA